MRQAYTYFWKTLPRWFDFTWSDFAHFFQKLSNQTKLITSPENNSLSSNKCFHTGWAASEYLTRASKFWCTGVTFNMTPDEKRQQSSPHSWCRVKILIPRYLCENCCCENPWTHDTAVKTAGQHSEQVSHMWRNHWRYFEQSGSILFAVWKNPKHALEVPAAEFRSGKRHCLSTANFPPSGTELHRFAIHRWSYSGRGKRCSRGGAGRCVCWSVHHGTPIVKLSANWPLWQARNVHWTQTQVHHTGQARVLPAASPTQHTSVTFAVFRLHAENLFSDWVVQDEEEEKREIWESSNVSAHHETNKTGKPGASCGAEDLSVCLSVCPSLCSLSFHHLILSFLGDLRWVEWFGSFWKSEPNQCEPNQSTYRQRLPEVCLHLFHCQDEDWFRIFWALLVQFGLGKVHQEGFGELWILGFFRSISSNLEVQKIWGMDVEMSPYPRKYKYLVKEVHEWNVVCCMVVWVVAYMIFEKFYMGFRWG